MRYKSIGNANDFGEIVGGTNVTFTNIVVFVVDEDDLRRIVTEVLVRNFGLGVLAGKEIQGTRDENISDIAYDNGVGIVEVMLESGKEVCMAGIFGRILA